jgi:hypothetical protein
MFARLRLGKIKQNYIRVSLHSFQNYFAAIPGNVKVANVEVGSEVGQLALCARLQVNEPEILMLDFSSQINE